MATVFVVAHDPAMRSGLTGSLTRLGHEVAASPTGEDALRSLSRRTFDVVVVDDRLPGITGLDVIATLRAMPAGDLPTVIVVTDDPGLAASRAAVDLRIRHIATEPVSRRDLLDVVANAIDERTRRDDRRVVLDEAASRRTAERASS